MIIEGDCDDWRQIGIQLDATRFHAETCGSKWCGSAKIRWMIQCGIVYDDDGHNETIPIFSLTQMRFALTVTKALASRLRLSKTGQDTRTKIGWAGIFSSYIEYKLKEERKINVITLLKDKARAPAANRRLLLPQHMAMAMEKLSGRQTNMT